MATAPVLYENMQVKPVITLAVVLIAWALISAKAARFSVTVPVALMLPGRLLRGARTRGSA